MTFQNKKSPRPFFGARFFVSKEYTHIGMFEKEECVKTIELSQARIEKYKKRKEQRNETF